MDTASNLVSVGNRAAARALLIGDRIDTVGQEHDRVLSRTPLAFPAGASGVVTLFRYGVVVLFRLPYGDPVEAIIAAAAVSLTFPAHAQLTNTTALTGTITDSSGASVPDVAVKAVNKATQDTYSAKTGTDGNFTIQFIRIGTYSITATKDGFSPVTQESIQIDANQTVRTNFTLQIGSVSQNVVVTAGAPPVSTDNAAAKETVSTRAVVELPLNGRNVLSIATSTPGVQPGLKLANGNPGDRGHGDRNRSEDSQQSLYGLPYDKG